MINKGNLTTAFEREIERSKIQHALAGEIRKQSPHIPFITAYIIAGDRLSAERAEELVKTGTSAVEASVFVGSYARFEFIVNHYKQGNISSEEFFKLLPREWSACDPDDTNREYLQLWKEAFERYGRIETGKPLKKDKILTIYRGQRSQDSQLGVSWTLRRAIARKFARGAALRQRAMDGVILKARISQSQVLAYLTQRGEEEVIVDPTLLDVEYYHS